MKIMFRGLMIATACAIFIGRTGAAPTPKPTPTPVAIAPPASPEILAMYNKLSPTLSQAARDWVADEAVKAAKNTKATEATIRADIQTRFTGQSLEEQDKSVLLYVALKGTVDELANDLSDMVNDFKKKAQKQNPDTAPAGGNINITLSPDDTLRLQTAVSRRTQFMTTMSNMLKKISDSQSSTVSFLK